jgi:acyl dehydratase
VREFATVAELAAAVGTELGRGDWLEVDQKRVDAFADVTEDHQWIHVDQERAAASPFGGTIVHGYLTVSLIPRLTRGLYRVGNVVAALNYGTNKIRFPTPLPVGRKVRAIVELTAVEEVRGGLRATNKVTVEAEGVAKPVCVAETLVQFQTA